MRSLRSARLVAALSSVLCAACASTPLAPARAEREIAVEYRASYAPQLGSAPASRPAEPAPPRAAEPAPSSAPRSEVALELVACDPADARAFAAEGGPFGRVLTTAEFERVRAELRTRPGSATLTAPKLVLRDGTRANVAVVSQSAFVRAFTLAKTGSSLVADPDVAVAREGIDFDVRSRRTPDGALALELELSSSALVRPFVETCVDIAGTSAEVTLQIPIAFEQHLTAAASLQPGEVLVLGGLSARDPDRALVAFVRSRALAREFVAQAGVSPEAGDSEPR